MPSAVFVLRRADGCLLMEQRPDRDDDFFPGAWLFPGGKIEPGEEPVAALMREATEELGITIVDAEPLLSEGEVAYARPGEQSHRLYPWLVTAWRGLVPDRVIDTDAVLAWRPLDAAIASPVECTRQIASAVHAWVGPLVIVDDLANVQGMYHGEKKAQAERVGARNGHQWCHLSSRPEDTDFAALHAFAALIGMRRQWFQDDHYDLVASRRAQAVRLGAVEVTRMEMAMVTLYDRRGRERPSYGRPELTTHAAQRAADAQLALVLDGDA